MKFVAISDTHGLHRKLKVPEGDVLIHGGDFCHYGSSDKLVDFLDWFKSLDFEYKILIAGNHDFFAAEHPNEFQELIPPSIIYLEDSGIEIKGVKFWGSPVQPDLIGWAFGRERGPGMKAHWDLMPNKIDVLITHTPPKGILDRTTYGKSIGCEELHKKIPRIRPKFHVFGHVHASYGQRAINETTFINASNINSRLGLVNKPVCFELGGE